MSDLARHMIELVVLTSGLWLVCRLLEHTAALRELRRRERILARWRDLR